MPTFHYSAPPARKQRARSKKGEVGEGHRSDRVSGQVGVVVPACLGTSVKGAGITNNWGAGTSSAESRRLLSGCSVRSWTTSRGLGVGGPGNAGGRYK